MLAKLPQLNKTCDEFIKQAHDINTGYILTTIYSNKLVVLIIIIGLYNYISE